MSQEEKDCELYAVKLLTHKDYSKFELQQKLMTKGFSAGVSHDVIQKLIDKNLFRESYYIEARINGLIRKRNSPELIRYKLKQENIECPLSYIENFFQLKDISSEKLLFEIIEKKWRSFKNKDDRFKNEQKLLSSLLAKGYDFSEAKQAVEKFFDSDYSREV